MLKIGKQNLPGRLTLPQMSSVPSGDDLQFLLSRSQRNWRQTVELPWKMLNTDLRFSVSVKCEMVSGEPCWSLFKASAAGEQMLWRYCSCDVYLIHNLIKSECNTAPVTGHLPLDAGDKDPAAAANFLSTENAQDPGAVVRKIDDEDPRGRPEFDYQLNKAILEGDLRNMQMPTLLQSVSMSKMTGRLEFQRKEEIAEIFFEEGLPLHALTPDTSGDLAFVELMTWEDGRFHFYEGEKTAQRTVHKRLETALMEGITLLDQTVFLNQSGLTCNSYLLQKFEDLSSEELALKLKYGAPVDPQEQERFYRRIDNKTKFGQLLRQEPVPMMQWTPILFNLINCGLVGLAERIEAPKQRLPEPVVMEKAVIDTAVRSLSRAETGILTYPALLYFVQQEYCRYQRGGLPFSLVVLEIFVKDKAAEGDLKPLPASTVKEVAARIDSVKRDLDIFGHQETFDFAVLLPHTHGDGAAIFTRRVEKALSSLDIAEGTLLPFFGVAALPEDCQDPGVLIAAAREAKNAAKELRTPLVLFSQMD